MRLWRTDGVKKSKKKSREKESKSKKAVKGKEGLRRSEEARDEVKDNRRRKIKKKQS